MVNEQEKACMAPLDRRKVSGREGPRGVTLDYVDHHYVRRRLCEVFGPLGFSTETVRMQLVSGPTHVKETRKNREGEEYEIDRYVTVYEATVRVSVVGPDGRVVSFKDGSAAGVGEDEQIGWSTHCAITEAETDALKRAAMQLGDSFGLALYDDSREHVASAAYTDAMAAIEAGKWSKEFGQKVWRHLSPSEQERVKEAVEAVVQGRVRGRRGRGQADRAPDA